MRAWLALVCVTGCNAVYDISKTELVDARYFDASVDAPFGCPATGGPRFGENLVQALPQNCTYYSESLATGLAMGMCRFGDEVRLAAGPVEGTRLEPVTLIGGALDFNHARLTPEGAELWVTRGVLGLSVYTRVDDLTWTFARDVSPPGYTKHADDKLATPTRMIGGQRRILIHSFNTGSVREYSDDGSVTTLVNNYPDNELGSPYVLFPNITADGLRLVFSGEPLTGNGGAATMYAERASVNDPFAVSFPLTTAPTAQDPYLREDCSRLYSWGLSSVFYAPEQL